MRLHLVTADAAKIVADLQFVKHFDGLFGGSEKVLDKATTGSLQSALAELESNRFLNSRIVKLRRDKTIGSKNLLILNLGDIRRFTLGDLDGAITHATKKALEHGFRTIATPVIGISDDVGLPIERAYRTVLRALVSVAADSEKASNRLPNITDVTIFDFNAEKVDFCSRITEIILTDLCVSFKRLTTMEYDLQLESVTRKDVVPHFPSLIDKSSQAGEFEKAELIKVLFLAAILKILNH